MRFSNTVHTRCTVRQNISLGVAVDMRLYLQFTNLKNVFKRTQIDNMNLYNLENVWHKKLLLVQWPRVSSFIGKQFT